MATVAVAAGSDDPSKRKPRAMPGLKGHEEIPRGGKRL